MMNSLRQKFSAIPDVRTMPDVAIYATGSFARGEAGSASDLDLFFASTKGRVPRLKQIPLFAQVIEICRDARLPEFSRDGDFLTFHELESIRNTLGSPEDDYRNHFTARLLLILESSPICNDDAYDSLVREVIDAYYRDFHDHSTGFKPIFLANDIVRFWKTLCLNYEHRRNRQVADITKKHDAHLSNLKLKFSRLLTCFSMLALIAQSKQVVEPSTLFEYVRTTPIRRLRLAGTTVPEGGKIVDKLLENYAWFLDATGKPKEQVLEWIGERTNRDDAFARARQFGDSMLELLIRSTSDNGILRYLII